MTSGVSDSFSLANILQQRRWQVCAEPFPHFVAHDVFTPDFYGWLDRSFSEALQRGLSHEHDPARFSRNIKNYDAFSLPFHDGMPEPFQVFMSPEWHDMLANLAGIRATRDINGGFHHHVRGSKSGAVHNDLNPCWFHDSTDLSRVNVTRNDICNYTDGPAPGTDMAAHEAVRALAVLFYLHNPPWRAGDGGETGLYSHWRQNVHSPTKAVPPINNSLFMFECRPNSFHSFISNKNGPRNSMIMWLHRTKDEAVERWGDRSIVYWSNKPKNTLL